MQRMMCGLTKRQLMVVTTVMSVVLCPLVFDLAEAADSVADRFAGKSPTIQAIQERGTLRAGAPLLLPMVAKDPKSGKFVGVGIELAQLIADDLGVELDVIEGSFTGAVPGILSHQWDINVGALWATEERLKVVNFVNYWPAGQVYTVLASRGDLNEWEDLNNEAVRIFVNQGTGAETIARNDFPNATILGVVQTTAAAVRPDVLTSNQADVVPIDSTFSQFVKDCLPKLKLIPSDGVPREQSAIPVGVAFAKGDDAWKEYLETVVAEALESGYLKDRLHHWTSSPLLYKEIGIPCEG